MLRHANARPSSWAEAIHMAAFLRNRTPNVNRDGKTPYELFHGTKPNIANLKDFGCLQYVHALELRDQPQNLQALRIGHQEGIDRRRCPFFENAFPNRHAPIIEALADDVEADIESDDLETHSTAARHAPQAPTKGVPDIAVPPPSPAPAPQAAAPRVPPAAAPRHKHPPALRALYPPAIRFVQQFVHCSETADVHTYLPVARPPPREQLMVDTPPANAFASFTSPLVAAPSSRRICKRKLHPDGTTAHKAWLVNRGYHQQYGINYLVTYSLTVKDESMHMTLA
ncbi:hypothetical protein AaE_004127 [Aphanomyces astaci]|uniref:Reverse transcriptase Ty1/copia-type domain-containing protein n=1 Tax=Aphanomyces astaci TaxID=112090 RepID=A0A6A5AT48_APHAT|nr:hypothetical protein AaE_004127 [Aphanomyces astaci]